MVDNYANQDPELLGIAPLIVPLITAGTTIGSLIAGGVINKRQQRRAAKSTKASEANALKLAELDIRRLQLSKNANLNTAMMIGIPAAVAGIFLIKKFKGKKGRKK